MAIARVTAHAAQAAVVSITTPLAGDVIVVFAHRDGSTTPPTLAADYIDIASGGANTNAARVGYRIAEGTEVDSGTWTGATSVAAWIGRGFNPTRPIGRATSGGAASASIAYNTATMVIGDGTSWVLGFAGHRTATNVGTATPTGMELQASATDVIVSDTNAGVASWSVQSKTVDASSGWRSYVVEILAPRAATPMPADVFVDMAVADVDGTVLTPSILAAGTIGSYGSWGLSTTPLTGEMVDAHAMSRNNTVVVGGTVYPVSHPSRRITFDHNPAVAVPKTAQLALAAGHRCLTVAGLIKFGPPVVSGSAPLYDYWVIQGAITGQSTVLQLNAGKGETPGIYAVNIETAPNFTTTHSADIVISPGVVYWCNLRADYNAGQARMAIWETDAWTLIGDVGSVCSAGEDLGNVNIGNGEAGTAVGATSWFENLLIDYLGSFPLGGSSPGVGVVGTVTVTVTMP